MAGSGSRKGRAAGGPKAPEAGWAKLTWEDLERWAGGRSVERGRSYQRGGRVENLKVSSDGELLATVVGGERYAVMVRLVGAGKRATLESDCTCPVGDSCKHAVATVAEYLQAIADKRAVPVASDNDPRWAELEEADDGDDDWDEDGDGDESWDEDEEESDEEPPPARASRPRKTSAKSKAGAGSWDAKIERHLRAKSQAELADLAWSLVRRFPEVYQELRERIALQQGDVAELLAEARREIRKVTSEPAWSDRWGGGGNIPDYSRVRHRFERLLELGHADEVVSLGRDFLERGLSQVQEAHDEEGETATAFGESVPVVFQAVARSSLSGPERLLFAIDAVLDDDYDTIGEAADVLFDAARPEDWSAVADVLTERLDAEPSRGGGDRFARDYSRDQMTNRIAEALDKAGRGDELGRLYEAEARATGSYERLVRFLLEQKRYDEAERWAREGIAATAKTYPGVAANLAESLCELARKRKQWDVVAAHAAHKFFTDYPSSSTFEALMEAAAKAGVEEPVRAAALRFLETGVSPLRRVAPPPAATKHPKLPSQARAATKRRAARDRAAASSTAPSAEERLTTDRAWPLPVPDYLRPLSGRQGQLDETPRPHLSVLLDMAIAAKKPDEVLHWYDKMPSERRSPGWYGRGYGDGYADRVAAAVADAYPERALAIYTDALNAQLPHAHQSAYEAAGGYLRKLRPLYQKLGRATEWTALVASIREKYRNRPRFMEVLDGLEGRTIVQSTRGRRR